MAKEAKKVEDALKEMSDVPPPDPRAGHATEQLDTLNRSAAGTKNAFANLVGNTAQDFSGMLGPLGSVGVAIGQVAEYTTDAANEGGGLTAALKGAASMAGPMLALAGVTLLVTNVIERQKKEAEADKKAVEDLTKSFIDGTGVLKDWADSLDEGFKAGTLDKAESLTKFIKDGMDPKDLQKTASAFGDLGLEIDDLGPVISEADQNFRSFATIRLGDLGFDPRAAANIAEAVDETEDLKLAMVDLTSGASTKNILEFVTPEQAAHLKDTVGSLEDLQDQVDHIDVEKSSKQFLDAAAATKEWRDEVKEARDASATEAQAALIVSDAIEEQTREREANTRATEEGARKNQEAGSILDQVGRQVVDAEDAMTEATEKNTKAQADWEGKVLDLPGAVDDFASSVLGLADGIKAQAKAGDEGAGSFDGYTKAALDNRDAQRDVFASAKDVIDTMGKQGASTEDLAAKTSEMAAQAYDLAIKNGLSEDAAALLRDTILTVPTSRSTEMTYQENNYGTMLDHRDALAEDVNTNVNWYLGAVDSNLQRIINGVNWNAPPGTVLSPSSASVSPAAGLRGLGGPVAAPVALAAPMATRAASVTASVPVVVNVNAGIVADTFQLQRAVVRGARSFQRLAGRRAAA
jgi:hypothetical protein